MVPESLETTLVVRATKGNTGGSKGPLQMTRSLPSIGQSTSHHWGYTEPTQTRFLGYSMQSMLQMDFKWAANNFLL